MSANFSHYNTFLCVAESGSISLAARRLGVSQPAVSAEISALETALDTPLFHRTSRGVTLTDAGRILHEHVKRGISCLRTGEARLRELKTLDAGSIRIGGSRDIVSGMLLDELTAFAERYPAVSISFTFCGEDALVQALKRGELDMAILCDPMARTDTDGITVTRFGKVQDILIAHPASPICRESRVTKRKLADYTIILDAEDSSQARLMQSCLPPMPKSTIHCDSSDMAIRLSENGLGVAAVTESAALDAIREGKVIRIDVADRIPARGVYVAVSAEPTPAADALRGIILELCTRSET